MRHEVRITHSSLVDQAMLHRLRDAAEATLRLWPEAKAAVLFGSRARGDHGPESDWDVAFITGTGDMADIPPSGMPVEDLPADVQCLALPARVVERRAAAIGDAGRGIARDGLLLAGRWDRPQMREKAMMDPEQYEVLLGNAARKAGHAVDELSAMATGRRLISDGICCDVFAAYSSDAAEYLAKAMLGRARVDFDWVHDLGRLARQASAAGHPALASEILSMNGRTKEDHVAVYGFRVADAAACENAGRRFLNMLDLFSRELGADARGMLDEEAWRGCVHSAKEATAAREEKLREAMARQVPLDGEEFDRERVGILLGFRGRITDALQLFAGRTRELLGEGTDAGRRAMDGLALQLACAVTERVEDGPLHGPDLLADIRGLLAGAALAGGIDGGAVERKACVIAAHRAEADLRGSVAKRIFGSAAAAEERARFGTPPLGTEAQERDWRQAVEDGMKELVRNEAEPVAAERAVSRAVLFARDSGREPLVDALAEALARGMLERDAAAVRADRAALGERLPEGNMPPDAADRDRMCGRLFRSFTAAEIRAMAEGRGSGIEGVPAQADSGVLAESVRTLLGSVKPGEAPWRQTARTMAAETGANRSRGIGATPF